MNEELQQKIREIFKEENIPAIVAVINHVRPQYRGLCKETEFDTIVNVAKLDGVQELVENIINYVQENKAGVPVGDK